MDVIVPECSLFIHTPGSLTCICAVDVTQLTKAEAVTSWWVNVTIHGHDRAAGGDFKHLPHLNVHFKVRDRAPKLWPWNENSKLVQCWSKHKNQLRFYLFLHKKKDILYHLCLVDSSLTWMIGDRWRERGRAVMLRPWKMRGDKNSDRSINTFLCGFRQNLNMSDPPG